MIKKFLKFKFIKFGIVGALGSVTNLIIFYLVVDLPKYPIFFTHTTRFHFSVISMIGATISFIISVAQNYILNHYWTFGDCIADKHVSLSGGLKYTSFSLVGFCINLIALNLIIVFFELKYKVIAQACGISIGMISNFLFSKFFVFARNKDSI